MQRSKVLAVVAALVAAGTAAIVLTGGASAASWHVYDGDMFAGHAYGLQVPGDAESIEFFFEGEEGATAQIGVYAPDGARAGFYTLSRDMTAARIASPDEGQYVVYVYEVGDGALSVRVSSETEPVLDLREIRLAREETRLGSFPQGPLDQTITAQLDRAPVFVTLLYEGSARGLDATVSSAKGAVVTITDETATAFSPGVWTSLTGQRAFDAAQLDGVGYTVEVHAEQFEGTMVLTTLALDVAAPTLPAHHTAPPAVPFKRVPATAPAASSAEFAIQPEMPVAFSAPAGKLLLADPEALACEAPADEKEDEHHYGYDGCRYVHALVSVYAPDDSLLALVTLDHEQAAAEIDLPVSGEYVVYVHDTESDVVLAKLLGASAAPALRLLEVAEEVHEIDEGDLLGFGGEHELTLAHVPLDVAIRFDGGLGAFSAAELRDADGDLVARADSFVTAGETPFGSWTFVDLENLDAGEHTLSVEGLYEGRIELVSTYFVRASEIVLDAEHDEHDEHDEHEDHGAPPAPPAPPPPPVVPAAAPVVAILDLL